MAGEFEKEPESTRARLAQADKAYSVIGYEAKRDAHARHAIGIGPEAQGPQEIGEAVGPFRALHVAAVGTSHNQELGLAQGIAQVFRAPGQMFPRSDFLAIIHGQRGIAQNFHAREALDALARIIENLE